MIKLSIALTTYNHEDFIEAALSSVFNQQLDIDFEVVIGNDCSTDGTLEIIQAYQEKHNNIRLLEYEKNVGYVVNFDKTMKACIGEYIAIFDGDDIMLANKLQQQVNFLDKHNDYVMVTHKNRAFISETGETVRYISPSKKKSYYTVEDIIQYGNIFGNSSKMFRKSAYPKDGIDYQIKHIADWYITIMITSKGKIGYLDKCLLDYRIHAQSIMKKIRGDMHFKDKMYILNQVSERFNRKYDHLFNRQKSYAYLIRGIHHYDQKQIQHARSDFMKSISISPFYGLSSYLRLVLTFLPRSLFKLIFDGKGNKIEENKKYFAANKSSQILEFNDGIVTCPSSYLFKTEFLKQYKITFNKNLQSSADKYFLLEVLKQGKIELINDSPMYYRVLNNSMSHKITKNLVKDQIAFYYEIKKFLEDNNSVTNSYYSRLSFTIAASAYYSKEYFIFIKYICKSFLLSPKTMIALLLK